MQEYGVDQDTTDESLWLRIREELDKRPLSSITDNGSLDQDSDYQLDDLIVS